MMKQRIIFLALCCLAQVCAAQERYFYSGKSFGSQALYNPLYLILNGSYDIIQLDGYSKEIFAFPYAAGSKNVLNNLGSPFSAITRYGWGKFLKNEVFPINWSSSSGGQWFPNYELHLIGGGMAYRMMREWYEEHRVAYPAFFSCVTMATYHLLDEFVENGGYEGDNVDPIADLYVFDAGGIILFSFDSISKFFSHELNLADWSLQPSFGLRTFPLHNSGQYFSLKWKLPFSERWHIFYHFGMNGLLGLSYKAEDGSAVSFGAGMRSRHIRLIDPSTNQKAAELAWNAGLFYDRENSLMASLLVSGLDDNMVSLNIYTGVFNLGSFSPGLWLIVPKNLNIVGGLSTIWTPGIAFGRR